MDDDTSGVRPQSPKAEPAPGPTDAELSRIARQAVHQPPDARLDKQLARMGLLDEPAAAVSQPNQPAGNSVAADPELERIRGNLRRARLIILALGALCGLLAIVVIALLVR